MKKTGPSDAAAAHADVPRVKTLEELCPIPDAPGAAFWRMIYPEGPLPRMPRRRYRNTRRR